MVSDPLAALFRVDAVSNETRSINVDLEVVLAGLPPLTDIDELRAAFARGERGIPVSSKSAEANTIHVDTPHGGLRLRSIAPTRGVRGAFLHLHGGGWVVGASDLQDAALARLADATGLVCVSVEYRLAPESPYPSPVDDCVAAAEWLIVNAADRFGTSWLAIGGESAGAHLAVCTLLRLRDQGRALAFKAASLMYGCYDLGLTPSARHAEQTLVINREAMFRFASAFMAGADPRDPDVSPLYADLHNLPPALFSVGTEDPLLDDSLFMHLRWLAATNHSELAIYPGAVHAFNLLEGDLSEQANARVQTFLCDQIASA